MNLTLTLQIAQCRSYLWTLGPNVGIIYRHGALGLDLEPRHAVGARATDSNLLFLYRRVASFLRVHVPKNEVRGFRVSVFFCTGFGFVYGYWVLGPLEV